MKISEKIFIAVAAQSSSQTVRRGSVDDEYVMATPNNRHGWSSPLL
jgi:hypothetical protein